MRETITNLINKIKHQPQQHLTHRAGWLRAAVLGANDGILSTASILSGMAAGGASSATIILAGLAGLVAGATSMATGEYVSVNSQSDIEKADLALERRELASNPEFELAELTAIYTHRGLEVALAKQVAEQLMAHDALGAHAQEELGIFKLTRPKPIQAAFVSAASFFAGGILPLVIAIFSTPQTILGAVILSALFALIILGVLGAKMSGVKLLKPTLRVVVWGTFSLAFTTLVGVLFGVKP